MAGRKLWLLIILPPQFITDGVEQLHVTLLRVLGQSSNEGLHGHQYCLISGYTLWMLELTYDMAPVAFPASEASALVCESLHPDHMMTSAGEVLVCFVFSAASEFEPMTVLPILCWSVVVSSTFRDTQLTP